jgi:hypothetical protein
MLLVLIRALLLASAVTVVSCANRSFIISGDSFLKDGVPFQVRSGSVHYFRHLPEDVPDRLRKARACGLNAVQTYIHWALHEPAPGVFARLDELTSFLSAAQTEGLLVVLRPGPYICGETQGGGLPGWLQETRGAGPGGAMIPRSADAAFLAAVDAWFAVLLPLLAPFLYSAGGPVVMAQVGNEEGYWSADAPANPYLAHVRGAFVTAWGPGAVIVHTTDGTLPALLHGGAPAGAFATVDFSPTDDAAAAFAAQRAANGGAGPAFNSELYIGGMNANWGDAAYANDTAAARNASLAAYEAILRSGASTNLYVFAGGTNWGLEAGLHADGAAHWQAGPYVPGGPLSEAGDFTDLGVGVCAALAASAGAAPPALPPPAAKSDYGRGDAAPLRMRAVAPLWAAARALAAAGSPTAPAPWPPTFEALGLESGYAVFEAASALAPHDDGSNWHIREVRDRAYVFSGDGDAPRRLGVRQRPMDDAWGPAPPANQTAEATAVLPAPARLRVLVDGMGRTCFGPWVGRDAKGLPAGLQLGPYAQPYVFNWSATALDLNTKMTPAVVEPAARALPDASWNASGVTPGLYIATLDARPADGVLRDTFLDLRGWGKGIVAINGRVLGRFWYLGPEFSLFVPAAALRLGANDIVIFETDGVGAGCADARALPPGEAPLRPSARAAACRNITDADGVPTLRFRTVPVRDLPAGE